MSVTKPLIACSTAFVVFLLHLSAGISLLASQGNTKAWEPPNAIISISFDNTENSIRLPVMVDGKPAFFLLDTGSTVTVVDHKLLRPDSRLRKPASNNSSDDNESPFLDASVTLVNGEKQYVPAYRPPTITVTGIELESTRDFVIGAEFATPEYPSENKSPIVGILGMDRLRRYCLHIDYDHKRLVILKTLDDKFLPPGEKHGFRLNYLSPDIPVVINGVKMWSTVDTGLFCHAFSVKSTVLNEILRKQRLENLNTRCINTQFLDLEWQEHAIAGEISFGSYREQDPKVHATDNSNLIGVPTLLRFRWTFDFQKRHVYILKSNRYSSPQHTDFDGIQATANKCPAGAKIMAVKKGSIAANAGVLSDDIILAVNSVNVSDMSPRELARIFHTERDNDLQMTVRRDDENLIIVLPRLHSAPQMENDCD